MILLRRVRPARPAGSSFDIDLTFDLGQALARQRRECLAPWRPPVEVFETERELVVRAEIAGLAGDEAKVLIEGDYVVVRGERRIRRSLDPRLYHESRIRYGPFEIAIQMPFAIDAEATTAEYVDGLLTVKLPRLNPQREENRARDGIASAQRGGQ